MSNAIWLTLGKKVVLQFVEIFKIAQKLIFSWDPIWYFQKMLSQKQIDN